MGVRRQSPRPDLRYEVRHPQWDVFPVRDYHIDLDWASLYGPEWAVLSGRAPDSVVLAAGSAVAVYPMAALPVPPLRLRRARPALIQLGCPGRTPQRPSRHPSSEDRRRMDELQHECGIAALYHLDGPDDLAARPRPAGRTRSPG